jgi:sporulation integral membrane protein YlbJ
MKRIIFYSGIFFLLFYLLAFPQEAFLASRSGLKLWFNTVLPALLPFLILSDILIRTDKIPLLLKPLRRFSRKALGLSVYGTYVFFLGLFCGYPMGAKLTGDLYRQNKISYNEASYLLSFSNNASPMFITTYILLNSLKIKGYTLVTFTILYLSVFLTSVIARIRYHRFSLQPCCDEIPASKKRIPLTKLMDTCIFQSFETITRLGGYIILFSIAASMAGQFTAYIPGFACILSGIIEITTGIWMISASSFDFALKYILILTAASFGGLSAAAQTKGVLNGTPLSLSAYLFGKSINALCTLILGILFFVIQSVI